MNTFFPEEEQDLISDQNQVEKPTLPLGRLARSQANFFSQITATTICEV
jgi:hypothetical protein